jgi:hypothetical protein
MSTPVNMFDMDYAKAYNHASQGAKVFRLRKNGLYEIDPVDAKLIPASFSFDPWQAEFTEAVDAPIKVWYQAYVGYQSEEGGDWVELERREDLDEIKPLVK